MDNKYWISKVKELEQAGKFDGMGTCPVCGVTIRGNTAQETFLAQEAHANSHKSLKITLTAFEVIEKTVKAQGSTGRVYLPVDWIGKRVKVILMEPID